MERIPLSVTLLILKKYCFLMDSFIKRIIINVDTPSDIHSSNHVQYHEIQSYSKVDEKSVSVTSYKDRLPLVVVAEFTLVMPRSCTLT